MKLDRFDLIDSTHFSNIGFIFKPLPSGIFKLSNLLQKKVFFSKFWLLRRINIRETAEVQMEKGEKRWTFEIINVATYNLFYKNYRK